jgi:hypothetical protein
MEQLRPLRLLRRQQVLGQDQVPNNNEQRLITATQVAARAVSLPPFFLRPRPLRLVDRSQKPTKRKTVLDVP